MHERLVEAFTDTEISRGIVMCEHMKFECLDTFDELYEKMRNNPDMAETWVKRHPCLLFCKKIAELSSVLQAVQELEEIEQMCKMSPYLPSL